MFELLALVSKRCPSLSDFGVREIACPSAFWNTWLTDFLHSENSVSFTRVRPRAKYKWILLVTDISQWAIPGDQEFCDWVGVGGGWPVMHSVSSHSAESGRCIPYLWHLGCTCLGTPGGVLVELFGLWAEVYTPPRMGRGDLQVQL